MLKEGVADKSAAKRAKAVHALGLLKDEEAQRMAEKALDDADKNVRSEGAVALGKMNRAGGAPQTARLPERQRNSSRAGLHEFALPAKGSQRRMRFISRCY